MKKKGKKSLFLKRLSLCLFISCLFFLLMNASPSWFRSPVRPLSEQAWIRTGGPTGGLGYDVRIHPGDKNIMFVTDNPSGVNKSYDAGKTWVQRNEGITSRAGPSLDGIPIFSLTIDSMNPEIIWAGTQNAKGIYRSSDGGETWMKRDNGIKEGNEISFRGFAVHPFDSDIVFAGAEISSGIQGKEFDLTRGKIYRTQNGGEDWQCVWTADNLVRIIIFDPQNPDIMYASTGIFDREAYNGEGVGVLKSLDGGDTWFPINNGIPNSQGNRFIGFLEMHPDHSGILFAAAGNNAMGRGGIFRTTDGGEHWKKVLADDIFTVVTLSPSNPNVVYAGSEHSFYRSSDMGETWQELRKEAEGCWGPPGVRAGFPISAVVDPKDPLTVFVNNYNGGNFVSKDGGQTWEDCSDGYTGAHLHDIAVDKSNSAVVYTIGRSGPFVSRNGGSSWQGLAYSPAAYPEWYAVGVNPQNSQEVIVSTEHEGVLLRSKDGGKSWEKVFDHPQACGDPQMRHGFRAITYAPSNPAIVYAGMCKGRRTIMGDFPSGPSFGMFKSTDGGATWQEINTGLKTSLINIQCIVVAPEIPDTVYIGTWRDGLFKTTDGGKTWFPKNNGLAVSDVCSLSIDPRNPEILYAGLGEGAGIYKSTDGGDFWNSVNSGINIQCPSYLLSFGQVQKGISFQAPPKIVPSDYYSVPWTSIWDIVIDPTNSQSLYAADHQSGVYMSSDGGESWMPLNEGLSTKAVTALSISSDGQVIYAATEGGGVFRLGGVRYGDREPVGDRKKRLRKGRSLR
ncbi:MAG: VPS10 domain-containing protein [Candidatus Aminicenantes bacterium]